MLCQVCLLYGVVCTHAHASFVYMLRLLVLCHRCTAIAIAGAGGHLIGSIAACWPVALWEGRWALDAGGLRCATAAVQQHQAASTSVVAPAVLVLVVVAAGDMAMAARAAISMVA